VCERACRLLLIAADNEEALDKFAGYGAQARKNMLSLSALEKIKDDDSKLANRFGIATLDDEAKAHLEYIREKLPDCTSASHTAQHSQPNKPDPARCALCSVPVPLPVPAALWHSPR
jgi:hypothetical protein